MLLHRAAASRKAVAGCGHRREEHDVARCTNSRTAGRASRRLVDTDHAGRQRARREVPADGATECASRRPPHASVSAPPTSRPTTRDRPVDRRPGTGFAVAGVSDLALTGAAASLTPATALWLLPDTPAPSRGRRRSARRRKVTGEPDSPAAVAVATLLLTPGTRADGPGGRGLTLSVGGDRRSRRHRDHGPAVTAKVTATRRHRVAAGIRHAEPRSASAAPAPPPCRSARCRSATAERRRRLDVAARRRRRRNSRARAPPPAPRLRDGPA